VDLALWLLALGASPARAAQRVDSGDSRTYNDWRCCAQQTNCRGRMECPFTGQLVYHTQALEVVSAQAKLRRELARASIAAVLRAQRLDWGLFEAALDRLRAQARIDIHFHPERLSVHGRTVAEGLLADGEFRNQYETGISSGSPTAFQGGARDAWEARLFGGAYHAPGAAPAIRPKYGALEMLPHPDGASPRFGSCYLVLKPQVSERATFTFGGSQEEDAAEKTGTLAILEPALAGLLLELARGQGALGVPHLTVRALLEQLAQGGFAPAQDFSQRALGRALDSFIEAQVHGRISLEEDVEGLVADPAFRGTATGEVLEALSGKYAIPLNWHPGFVLPVSEVPQSFRGYEVQALAQRVAGEGLLDAAVLGSGANTLALDPDSWQGWVAEDEILTRFRRLWHVLVLIGRPRREFLDADGR